MTLPICVDSGIVIKLVVNEPDSEVADALWRSCLATSAHVVAPSLMPIEVTAVLRKLVYRGILTTEQGKMALDKALNFQITILSSDELHHLAWELATRFNRPTAYDAHYLALSQELTCDFWTADLRLFNSVSTRLKWVRWLGDYSSPDDLLPKP